MKKIRIGNTFDVLWGIYAGEGIEEKPYNLQGRTLHLYMSTPTMGVVEVKDFSTQDHILRWRFEGKNQQKTGTYTLTLVENKGDNNMRTVDECNAFSLVAKLPSHHGDCDCNNVQIEMLELKSKLMFASTSNEVVKPNYVFPINLGDVQSGSITEQQLGALREAIQSRTPFMVGVGESFYPATYAVHEEFIEVGVVIASNNSNRTLSNVHYVVEIENNGDYTTYQHNVELQAKLISGVNIATINGISLLDGGNIEIAGGGGDPARIPDEVIVEIVNLN